MKKILVGYDESQEAKKALSMAADMARCFGAELIVLTVVPEFFMPDIDFGTDVGLKLEEEMERTARAALAKVEEDLKAKGLSYELLVEKGRPARVILENAKERGVDIIVLGSRGSGLTKALLGSVSYKVAHHANCSVVLVR
ncbi:universal stress protein [Thermosulfuriphilus sp.]